MKKKYKNNNTLGKFELVILFFLMAAALFAANPEKSVVEITITSRLINYYSPWKSEGTNQTVVMGTLIEGNYILAPALFFQNVNMIEVSKLGNKQKYFAHVVQMDCYSGIAFLQVDDEDFCTDLEALQLLPPRKIPPTAETYQALQWASNGTFTTISTRYQDTLTYSSFIAGFMLLHRFSTSVEKIVPGAPVVDGNYCAGFVFTVIENMAHVLSSTQILQTLGRIETYPGLPFWAIETAPLENDQNLRKYLKLDKEETGVYITRVHPTSSGSSLLKPGDVILEIDGVNIDDRGLYNSAYYDKLSYNALIFLNHFAGEKIKVKIIRDGKQRDLTIPLHNLNSVDLVVEPLNQEGKDEYYLFGGLLFQNLNQGYFTNWGPDWGNDADPRLLYYYQEYWASPSPRRERIVVLNRILESDFSAGYVGFRNLPLESINGQPVANLAAVKTLIEGSKEKLIVFEFAGQKRIVLDRVQAITEGKKIMQAYDIGKNAYFRVE